MFEMEIGWFRFGLKTGRELDTAPPARLAKRRSQMPVGKTVLEISLPFLDGHSRGSTDLGGQT